MLIYPGTGCQENYIKIAAVASHFGCLHQFRPNASHSEPAWANKMIFTSSSVTSFQKSQSLGKINTKCQLSGRRMLRENANFSSSCISRMAPLQGEGTETRGRSSSLTSEGRVGSRWGGREILCWMFINYLCLQAECTIVLSETLTFSISPRFGASYKVHCEKGVLTLRMIWRTEIPLSFIIYPGWPRGGKQAVALSYLTG